MSNTGLTNFYYRTKGATERDSIAAILERHGYSAANVEAGFDAAPVIVINKGAKVYSYSAKGGRGMEQITITKILNNQIKAEKKPIDIFRIYGYTVTVHPTQVHIGCQRMTFEQVDKLYQAVQKQRSEED